MVDLHLGQGCGGQRQLQPQAPRAMFQAWTPNNYALLVEAGEKLGWGTPGMGGRGQEKEGRGFCGFLLGLFEK